MKKRYYLLIFILVIIGLWLFLSPSSPAYQSYNGTAYSFNYPSTWNISWENDNYTSNEPYITLTPTNDTQNISIDVFDATDVPLFTNNSTNSYNMNRTASSLNDCKNSLISLYSTVNPNESSSSVLPDPNYQVLNNTTINVNGLNGFDMLFKSSDDGLLNDPPVFTEVVILQKGTNFYQIELDYGPNITTPYAHDDFMTIVNSFKIK
jgi:hypothetical protein